MVGRGRTLLSFYRSPFLVNSFTVDCWNSSFEVAGMSGDPESPDHCPAAGAVLFPVRDLVTFEVPPNIFGHLIQVWG